MNPRFLTLLGAGLVLMGLFWWRHWQAEQEWADASAPIMGCAKSPNCPKTLPTCLTAFGHPDGVCSAPCQVRNQCPERWCCAPVPGEAGERVCAPQQACAALHLN